MREEESSGAVGPWDESDARRPRHGEPVRLGGLLVPTRAGAETRLMTSRDGSLVAVTVIRGRTAIQLNSRRRTDPGTSRQGPRDHAGARPRRPGVGSARLRDGSRRGTRQHHPHPAGPDGVRCPSPPLRQGHDPHGTHVP
ncbi:DUF3710 domain-containing protein [Streptomyces sp. SLBN-8D4]|uniref:DUF3710 domain-containing protein n=1 Tax=Streptomyces sp. SLBN-8D4 TaxID=3377728 RepID=UPI003C7B95BE